MDNGVNINGLAAQINIVGYLNLARAWGIRDSFQKTVVQGLLIKFIFSRQRLKLCLTGNNFYFIWVVIVIAGLIKSPSKRLATGATMRQAHATALTDINIFSTIVAARI